MTNVAPGSETLALHCKKQSSNLTSGHMGPLRRKSEQTHSFSPLRVLVSSSHIATPVPFTPTGDRPFEKVSHLKNVPILPRHVGEVSFASPSASVTSVSSVPAAVPYHPVGGRLQNFGRPVPLWEQVIGWCPS